MSNSQSILLFLSAIGIVQAIFIGGLLIFNTRSDRLVNLFLALHIVALTFPIVMPLIQILFSWQVIILLEPLLTLSGPLLYLYVRGFKERITWKKAWPHFVFFLVCIPLAIIDYSVVGSKYPPASQIPKEAVRHFLLMLPISLRLIQRIVYYFLSRNALNAYQKSILHLFSDTSRISLNWVRWLINGYLCLIIMTLLLYPLMLVYPAYFNFWILLSGALVSVYIYLAAFRGSTQSSLWQLQPHVKKEVVEEEMAHAEKIELQHAGKDNSRPRKAGLNQTQITGLAEKIVVLLEKEKLYQEPDLTLQQLAGRLESTIHHLSQAINDGLGKNFYDLVNGYRVEEAKRLLLDPKNSSFTILSVGFEAGFNSKTTFNTVFKKFTGQTPTEYRAEQKSVSSLA